MEEFRTVQTDVLIIGAGAAGGRAAIEASKNNVSVVLVEKGVMGQAGSTPTAGQRVATSLWQGWVIKSPGDDFEIFKLTVKTMEYLYDQDILWQNITEAPEVANELKEWGKRDINQAVPELSGNFSQVLKYEVMRRSEITLLEHVIITKLLTRNGKIVGATGLDIRSGEFILFKAKAVVLATGGYGELYQPSECTPLDIRTGGTGDGQSLTYHAGVELCEMEMVEQAMITDSPKWNEATRHVLNWHSHSGPFYDKDGNVCISEEEMTAALPKHQGPHIWEHQRQIYQQMMNTKGPLYTHVTEKTPRNVTEKELHVDTLITELPYKVRVAIGPLIGQGGPKINVKGETNVLGLYGTGDGNGNLWGAWRCGGSISMVLALGRRVGKYAAEYARTAKQGEVDPDEVREELDRVNGFLKPKPNPIRPNDVKKKIWEMTGKHLFMIMNAEGCEKAIKEVEEMRRKDLPRIQAADIRNMNLEWVDAIEVPCMLDVAEMIARSALFRKESRGCHWRSDYPSKDNDNWLCHTLLKKEDDKMVLSKAPVVMTKFKPASRTAGRESEPIQI